MNKYYTVYKCKQCGTIFAIPTEQVNLSNNYVSCPLHGKHNATVVIGAYDDLNECMGHDAHQRRHGAIRQR